MVWVVVPWMLNIYRNSDTDLWNYGQNFKTVRIYYSENHFNVHQNDHEINWIRKSITCSSMCLFKQIPKVDCMKPCALLSTFVHFFYRTVTPTSNNIVRKFDLLSFVLAKAARTPETDHCPESKIVPHHLSSCFFWYWI